MSDPNDLVRIQGEQIARLEVMFAATCQAIERLVQALSAQNAAIEKLIEFALTPEVVDDEEERPTRYMDGTPR